MSKCCVYADSSYCQVGCTGIQMKPHYSISQRSPLMEVEVHIKKKNLLHTLGINLFMNSNHMSATTFKSYIKNTINCYWPLHIFRFLDDLIFSISLDGQSPLSLLYNGYQDTFLGLGCGVDHSPPFSTKFKEETDLYLYPSAPTWHVTGQACSTLFVIWATSANLVCMWATWNSTHSMKHE